MCSQRLETGLCTNEFRYVISVVSSTDWTGLDEDEDAHVWEDNWDDDNVEDDFSNQLR